MSKLTVSSSLFLSLGEPHVSRESCPLRREKPSRTSGHISVLCVKRHGTARTFRGLVLGLPHNPCFTYLYWLLFHSASAMSYSSFSLLCLSYTLTKDLHGVCRLHSGLICCVLYQAHLPSVTELVGLLLRAPIPLWLQKLWPSCWSKCLVSLPITYPFQ